jgi:hypothetical protein
MLTVEIFQFPTLRSFLSGEYAANELSQFATAIANYLIAISSQFH